MFWGEFRVWLILFTMQWLTLALLISIFICLKLKLPRQFLSLNEKLISAEISQILIY